MPGKRKADEMVSPETMGKVSKKAALEAARQRAREFAQRDKEKIEKARSNKSQPAAKAVPTTQSPDKKMSVAERKRIAKENAKVFAARDKASLESKASQAKKKATVSQTPKQTKPKAKKTSARKSEVPSHQEGTPSIAPMDVVNQHGMMPNMANTQMAGYQASLHGHQNAGYGVDPGLQHMMQMQEFAWQQQQQQQQLWHQHQQQLLHQQQQQQDLWRTQQGQVAQPMQQNQTTPKTESKKPQATQKKSTRKKSRKSSGDKVDAKPASADANIVVPPLQPMKSKSSSKVDRESKTNDEEFECPPPPPELTQAQVSQLVLSNAQNAPSDIGPSSDEDEPDTAVNEDQMAKIEDSEMFVSESNAENKEEIQTVKDTKLQVLAPVIVVILAAVFIQMMASSGLSDMLAAEPTVSNKTLCYVTGDADYQKFCSEGVESFPCPNGAVCEGGKIVACENYLYAVSDQGNQCVLAENYQPMREAITDELVRLSSQICDRSSKPTFKYSMLQNDDSDIFEEESEELFEALENEGFVVREMDGLYVGLSEDFELQLPLHCTLGNIGQWILQKVGLVILGLFSFICGLVISNPVSSGVFGIIVVGVLKFTSYRAAKAKHQEDIRQTRKLAYRTLEETPGVEHWAVHIRDEIARMLYPESKKLQLELQRKVWPKIVDDVKRDTRVRKFQKTNKDGKIWDVWQWTAATKKTQ